MNGVINFLKPPGMSSNGAVIFTRGVLGLKKTGHAGTLDPGACGVLPICVGKATKISSYLMGGKKEYIAQVTFGKSTDTGDSYGKTLKVSKKALPDKDDVKKALESFLGETTQQTPAYSAVKHQGRKMYQLARQGIEVEPKKREIVIYEAEYLNSVRNDSHLIRVACGKGTYIRTLCEDIGKSLEIPAYMSFLIRSKCAGLSVNDSITADELKSADDKSGFLLPMNMFLKSIPRIKASKEHRTILVNGGSLNHVGEDANTLCIYIEGELLGIGSLKDNMLKITTLLVDR